MPRLRHWVAHRLGLDGCRALAIRCGRLGVCALGIWCGLLCARRLAVGGVGARCGLRHDGGIEGASGLVAAHAEGVLEPAAAVDGPERVRSAQRVLGARPAAVGDALGCHLAARHEVPSIEVDAVLHCAALGGQACGGRSREALEQISNQAGGQASGGSIGADQ